MIAGARAGSTMTLSHRTAVAPTGPTEPLNRSRDRSRPPGGFVRVHVVAGSGIGGGPGAEATVVHGYRVLRVAGSPGYSVALS